MQTISDQISPFKINVLDGEKERESLSVSSCRRSLGMKGFAELHYFYL